MKKILSICAILMLCAVTLFAQNSVPVSKTSQATNGVFKTDVDNFADVNAWKNVDINNMFTSISYGSNGVELGFAKNLENGFLGLWLIGDVGFDFTSESTSGSESVDMQATVSYDNSTTSVVTDYSEKGYTENGKGSVFSLGALYGKGDIAYKAAIYYQGNAADSIEKSSSENNTSTTTGTSTGTTTENTSMTTKSEDITDSYILSPAFSVGLNTEKADYYGTVALDIMKNTTSSYSYTETTGQDPVESDEDPEDNDTIAVTIGGGASFDLAAKENLTQKFAVNASGILNFIEDDVVEDDDTEDKIEKINVTKYNKNSISVKPSYSFKYKGDEKLTVGFIAYANMVWNNSTEKNLTSSRNTDSEATSYTNSESETKDFTSEFKLSPYATLAIAYDVIPSKLTFNASTTVVLPTLEYKLITEKATSKVSQVEEQMGVKVTTDTNATGKSSEFTVEGTSVKCAMNFASGFTYNLSKNLTFDATWNIVSDLFNPDLSSNLTGGDDKNIMNTLNKVLVHNVSLGITFKM